MARTVAGVGSRFRRGFDFDKTGVHSRRELVQCLYFEGLLPGVLGL